MRSSTTPCHNNGYFNGTTNNDTSTMHTRIAPLNAGQFEPINRANYTQSNFALHPGAYPLKTLFDSQDLTFIANIGTLVGTQNITRANFDALRLHQAAAALLPLRSAGAVAVLAAR